LKFDWTAPPSPKANFIPKISPTRAYAKGAKFGRPPALTVHQRQEASDRLAKGEAQADVARSYAVS
jgi:hypothetical protein